jgi:hypothetical protein
MIALEPLHRLFRRPGKVHGGLLGVALEYDTMNSNEISAANSPLHALPRRTVPAAGDGLTSKRPSGARCLSQSQAEDQCDTRSRDSGPGDATPGCTGNVN